MKIAILLTATIKPSTTFNLKRQDPLIREDDYTLTLEKIFQSTPYPIVFCENSNYQSTKIVSVFGQNKNRECELIQYKENYFSPERGKGYGEIHIIKYALERSNILKESDLIIKISGRYYVENLKKIMPTLNESTYIMSDYNKNKINTYCGLFIAKPDFFTKYLFKYIDFIDDSKRQPLERALTLAIKDALLDQKLCSNFTENPIIEGYSGTFNIKIDKKNYNSVNFSLTKLKIIIFPWMKQTFIKIFGQKIYNYLNILNK